jgi:hypothetical protein
VSKTKCNQFHSATVEHLYMYGLTRGSQKNVMFQSRVLTHCEGNTVFHKLVGTWAHLLNNKTLHWLSQLSRLCCNQGHEHLIIINTSLLLFFTNSDIILQNRTQATNNSCRWYHRTYWTPRGLNNRIYSTHQYITTHYKNIWKPEKLSEQNDSISFS